MNEQTRPSNPCSPVTDNPAEDAFYRRAEASISSQYAVEAAQNIFVEFGRLYADQSTRLNAQRRMGEIVQHAITAERAEDAKTIAELCEYKDKLHEVVAELKAGRAESGKMLQQLRAAYEEHIKTIGQLNREIEGLQEELRLLK